MKDDKLYLTEEGYQTFLKELEEIQESINSNGRNKSSAYTSAVGDGWHDNFAFEEATREEKRLLGLLREKRALLDKIVIVEETKKEDEIVNIGDFLLCDFIFSEDDREEQLIHLIGSTKPDLDKEYTEVTMNSPIGRAIYNQKIGSIVKYHVEKREFVVQIKEKVQEMGLGK